MGQTMLGPFWHYVVCVGVFLVNFCGVQFSHQFWEGFWRGQCGQSIVNSSQNRCFHFPKNNHFLVLFGTILAPFWHMLPHLGLQKGASENVSKIDPPKSCRTHARLMQDSCRYHASLTSKSPRCPLRCHNMTPTWPIMSLITIMSYEVMWSDVMWSDVKWCVVKWCEVMWSEVKWWDVMWCEVM